MGDNYREIAEEAYGENCQICGEEYDTVHHRDRNHDNNDPKNLLPLCSSCHNKIHSQSRGYEELQNEAYERADDFQIHDPEEILSVRIGRSMAEYAEDKIAEPPWAGEEQIMRDLFWLGIIHSELVSTPGLAPSNSPIQEWQRPRGIYPNNDSLLCPNCAQANKWLFTIRDLSSQKEESHVVIQCLACGEKDDPDAFTLDLPKMVHWVYFDDEWHLSDPLREDDTYCTESIFSIRITEREDDRILMPLCQSCIRIFRKSDR